jgi:uncharacterized protein (DUF305 family)
MLTTDLPRRLLPALLLVSVLVLAACGDDQAADTTAPSDDPADQPGTEETGAAAFNDADVAFLQGMIPHHEEAIEMAEMVPERTDRPELNELADDIIASQQGEIEEMQAMLAEAGADEDPDMAHMDDDMMMDEHDIERLGDAEAVEFDLLFADLMIEHHEGAIVMARDVLDDGEHPQVATLAQDVIDEQEAEIAQLREWRADWADEQA